MKKLICSVIAGMVLICLTMTCYAEYGDYWSIRNQDRTDIARITSNETLILSGSGGLSTSCPVKGMIFRVAEYIVSPAVPDSTSILNNDMIDSVSSGGTVPNLQTDVPRNVNIAIYTYANANVTSTGTVGVYGINAKGNVDYESIAFTSLSANSITTAVSNKAFALIRLITTDAALRSTAGYGDTMTVGYGYSYGFANDVYGDTIYKLVVNGVSISSNGYVTGTVDGTYDTYRPATDWAATDAIIYYKANIKGRNE